MVSPLVLVLAFWQPYPFLATPHSIPGMARYVQPSAPTGGHQDCTACTSIVIKRKESRQRNVLNNVTSTSAYRYRGSNVQCTCAHVPQPAQERRVHKNGCGATSGQYMLSTAIQEPVDFSYTLKCINTPSEPAHASFIQLLAKPSPPRPSRAHAQRRCIQLFTSPPPQPRSDAAAAAHSCHPQPAIYQHSVPLYEAVQTPRQRSAFPAPMQYPNCAPSTC